jgi:phi13 family phage major tail protein
MDQKYGEFVGVDNLHAAIITEDSEANYIADVPEYFAPSAEIAGEPEINNTTTYYDNGAANNYVTEGITALEITVSGVPASIAAKYLGKNYDATSGRVLDTGEPNPPLCAVSFRFNRGTDGYRYYQYLKGTFSGGSEEAVTKKDNIEVRTYQLTYTAVKTTHKWEIDGVDRTLKRILADTSDPAFNPTGWFTQVQTPDTSGAPNAVELSTIVPSDGSTAINLDANIVMTFNNKIKTEEVVLLNSNTGDVVAVTKSWNATGKVLTITPDANMTASTKYIVSVTGVVDVYGQKLAASGVDFTTGTE